MNVLTRSALEESPLADLHLLASELGIDSFRRLRRDDLIDAIVERQGAGGEDDAEPAAAEAPARRRTRSGRGRGRAARDADAGETEGDAEAGEEEEDEESPARPARGGRARASARDEEEDVAPPVRRARGGRAAPAPERAAPAPERAVEGVVELLGNGSGFLRVSPPDPSDDDVYISAAQVRRCELVSGDRVGGPVRAPRRSERYPSLIRVDTINDRPADEVAEGTPFDDLPAAFPTERFSLGADDPTLKAIEWLTPLGRGSRATITGAPRSGKSEALRRLAGALAGVDGLDVSVVLAGVRPEEITEWKAGAVQPVAAASFAASPDAQAATVERAVETARRIAARGGDAVLLVDTLDGLHPPAARKALAAARNIADGGSLTVIATATKPLGGETTVIALDYALTSTGRFPAVDLAASGTLRPELLVGEAGADAIAQARAAALA